MRMRKWAIAAVILLLVFSGVAIGYFMNPTGVPPVKGYMEGKEIYFIHTEVSDAKIAQLLTGMKASPVLLVPSLAQASESMLTNVYVFTNGIRGGGPLGFQPDVFDDPPGTKAYSPLRRLNLVTWKNVESARLFTSAAGVEAVIEKGDLTIQRPGVVINMPLLTWPGGRR